MSRALPILLSLLLIAMPVRAELTRVQFNHPGLTSDLGVGLWAWPLPMDWDSDGDLDLVVSCPDVPFNGTYFFENKGDDPKLPTFKPPARLGPALRNVQLSVVDGKPRLLVPGREFTAFFEEEFRKTRAHKVSLGDKGKTRANQWRLVDYDGDGILDMIIGLGLWSDYGWDNAFDENGKWTRGPLHGHVYFARNRGSNKLPIYEKPQRLHAAGKPIDVFGMPSPNLADFDGDGDLDLICGEFLDGFTYFRNDGTRKEPVFANGEKLSRDGKALAMTVQMITPTAIDWDRDGDVDLVVGDEDGRVALVENTGQLAENKIPIFERPRYFQQEARELKFGALVTPNSVDWDGDGDEDLICGNTAGHIAFIENLDGGNPPRWARPVLLHAGGKELRILAGPDGSIQGPAEAKWGYTTQSVADWDHDGDLDLVVNSIWGKVIWYRNEGTRKGPKLAAAEPLRVKWDGKPPKPDWNWWVPEKDELATQWRTTPVVVDWNGDGLNDLVMLDHEGYLAFFERQREGTKLVLLPGRRTICDGNGKPLRLNERTAGKSGRRKLCIIDWNGDGKLDLLANSKNTDLYLNRGKREGNVILAHVGPMAAQKLAGHTTSPTTVDWDRDGVRDLLIGAEDGRFYYQSHKDTQAHLKGAVVEKKTFGKISVHGSDFEFKTLENGGTAFGNRKYKWIDVPESLRGWTYTRTKGGEKSLISLKALDDTDVYMATAPSATRADLADWEKVPNWIFRYTDKGKTKLRVYKRKLKQGTSLSVPQVNWTGSLLLFPKTTKPLSKATTSHRRES